MIERSFFGVCTHLTKIPQAHAIRQIGQIRDAGFGSLRVGFLWDQLEPEPGVFRWEIMDPLIRAAGDSGIRILGTIARTPSWLSNAADGGRCRFYPPREPEPFAAFCAGLAKRYPETVEAWEIWNEPDLKSYWHPKPDHAHYISILRAAYNAIKTAVPSATVMNGGIACCREHRINFDYLEALFRSGLSSCTDVLNVHPYSGPNMPETLFDAEIDRLLSLAAQYRASGLPVWFSEIGTPVHPRFALNEAEQAAHITRHCLCALRRPEIQRLFWYDFHDDGTDPDYFEHHFGLTRHDDSPKPSYHAAKSLIPAVAGGTFQKLVRHALGPQAAIFRNRENSIFFLWDNARNSWLLKDVDFEFREWSNTGTPLPLFRKERTADLTIGPEPIRLEVAAADEPSLLRSFLSSSTLIGI